MSDFFDHLFDSEYRQRDDINQLRHDTQNVDLDVDILRGQLAATQARLDRAELVLEALFMYLENQELLNREVFALVLREVDRLDGKQDGRAGVKPSEAESS